MNRASAADCAGITPRPIPPAQRRAYRVPAGPSQLLTGPADQLCRPCSLRGVGLAGLQPRASRLPRLEQAGSGGHRVDSVGVGQRRHPAPCPAPAGVGVLVERVEDVVELLVVLDRQVIEPVDTLSVRAPGMSLSDEKPHRCGKAQLGEYRPKPVVSVVVHSGHGDSRPYPVEKGGRR